MNGLPPSNNNGVFAFPRLQTASLQAPRFPSMQLGMQPTMQQRNNTTQQQTTRAISHQTSYTTVQPATHQVSHSTHQQGQVIHSSTHHMPQQGQVMAQQSHPIHHSSHVQSVQTVAQPSAGSAAGPVGQNGQVISQNGLVRVGQVGGVGFNSGASMIGQQPTLRIGQQHSYNPTKSHANIGSQFLSGSTMGTQIGTQMSSQMPTISHSTHTTAASRLYSNSRDANGANGSAANGNLAGSVPPVSRRPGGITNLTGGDDDQQSGSQHADPRLAVLRFNQNNPTVLTRKQTSGFDSAVAAIKREGPQLHIPGGCEASIGFLEGKLVVRGNKATIDELSREDGPFKHLVKQITFIEDGATPSDMIVAIDFDKTLAKSFLWAELGGLSGATAQKQALQHYIQDGRLKKAFGGDERILALRNAITQRLRNGDFVCVLSSGFASVIRIALHHVGLSDILPSDLIYGCDTGPYGISKSARLLRLKEKYGKKQSALIDDDLNYCRQAFKEGHKVIWVRDGCGMEERELSKLLQDTWDTQQFLDSQGRIGG